MALYNASCVSQTENNKQLLKCNHDSTMSYDNYSPRNTIFINLLTITEDVQ